MELTKTAYVILGMLRLGKRTGYEIKSLVDVSTRFFWAASYGQIYPELRRLAVAGLIEGEPRPQGGRKRVVYSLTPAGRRELRTWLDADPQVFELRDEGLLKLFFADAVGGASAPETLAAKRRHHEQVVERLREVERSGAPEGYADLVLHYGIEFNQWIADWCERTRLALEEDGARDRKVA